MIMDYEVGSIADLVSGQRTPNRRPVVCRVVTPRKQPPQTPLTPTDSPMIRVKPPKIAFTPEYNRKRQLSGCNGNEFDSPKSEPRRRRSNLAENFRSYSQSKSDDDEESNKKLELKKDKHDMLLKKSKESKKNKKDDNSEDKDSGITDSGSNDMTDEMPNENVKQKKKKNKRRSDNADCIEEFVVVTKKKRKVSLDVDTVEEYVISKKKNKSKIKSDIIEEPVLVKKKKCKDILEEDIVEPIVNKKKNKFNTEIDNAEECVVANKKKRKNSHGEDDFEEMNDIDDDDVSKKKKHKKNKKKDGIQFDDALEKTIEKKKKKLKSTVATENEDNAIEESENDDEELSEFQKAAQRRVNLKMKRNLKFEPEELNRTVFIGNVPLSVVQSKYKKTFKNIFSKYGVIETIRVRNIPLDDIKSNPKVALIEKKFHNDRSTATVFIKFKDTFSVEKALVENNTVLEGNHIRVDSCDKDKTRGDNRRTLFLGNLPFNIEEEMLREMFVKCGEIKSIRIVRDSKTQIGKGFGFVNFERADGVELALMMSEEDLKINGRAIRVHRYNLSHNSAGPQRNDTNYRENNAGNSGARKVMSSKHNTNSMNKKRDEFGNKIRKTNTARKERRMKFNQFRTNDSGADDENNSKNNVSANYAGLVAKKKKKTKLDKGIMKKKRISKILLHKKSD